MEEFPDQSGRAAEDDPVARSRRAIERAKSLGFALAGVCEARPSDYAEHVRAWLAAGMHGDMGYLADRVAQRLDPALMLPGVRSMIAVGDLYASRDGGGVRESVPGAHGRVARYGRGKDYHKVIKRRLHALCDGLRAEHPGHEFRACVDIEPNLEREHAQRAGLGWVGRHTLLIHPREGSYFLLGLVLTTLALTAPPEQGAVADHCGTCTRCIEACPTGAIAPARGPRAVDARRCVSYLTLETRGEIAPEFHRGVGDMLAGCDICQEVCPHNSARADASEPNEAYAPRVGALPLLEVLGWTGEDRAARLPGSALKRATLTMWKRNAIIAAGNAVRDGALDARMRGALTARIRDMANDEEALLRTTAATVLAALEQEHGGRIV